MAKPHLAQLAQSTILDASGNSKRIEELWSQQPAVLVFLRHFACIDCRAHAVKVWADHARYEKAGAKVFFIGNGQPHFIQMFKEDLNLKGAEIYTDPTLKSFDAAGLTRGALATVGPQALWGFAKLALTGARQKALQEGIGSATQQGGVVVVRSTAGKPKVLYAFASKYLGDLPSDADTEELIKALG